MSALVAAAQRVASGEDEMREGVAEAGDLVEELDALVEGEFLGMRGGHGLGAAVAAGECASLGHFPVNIHRRLGEIAQGMGFVHGFR